MQMFRDPSLSPYELEVSSFSHQNETEAQQPPEAQSLLDVTEQLKDASHTERSLWSKFLVFLFLVPMLVHVLVCVCVMASYIGICSFMGARVCLHVGSCFFV